MDRKWPVSTSGGTQPRWSRTAREVFYRDGNRMLAVAVNVSGGAARLSAQRLLFEREFTSGGYITIANYDVLPDGSFVMTEAEPGAPKSVIVDLAAQTAAPLTRWIKDSDLFAVLADMGIAVNFWHVADPGKDSVDLLGRLINTFEDGPNYFIVKNLGRGSDFSLLDESLAMEKAIALGARVVTLTQLHEATMRKIDRQNASFWAAINNREGSDYLGLLERQRVKHWLRATYSTFDELPL